MLTTGTDQFETGINALIVVEISLNFFFAMALMKLVGFINILQLIAFSTMMNLIFPPNIQMFNGAMIKILNVDIFDPEWTTMLIFNFSKDILQASKLSHGDLLSP